MVVTCSRQCLTKTQPSDLQETGCDLGGRLSSAILRATRRVAGCVMRARDLFIYVASKKDVRTSLRRLYL
jgi:hypothetical protein